jgi:hypothetical protein
MLHGANHRAAERERLNHAGYFPSDEATSSTVSTSAGLI